MLLSEELEGFYRYFIGSGFYNHMEINRILALL